MCVCVCGGGESIYVPISTEGPGTPTTGPTTGSPGSRSGSRGYSYHTSRCPVDDSDRYMSTCDPFPPVCRRADDKMSHLSVGSMRLTSTIPLKITRHVIHELTRLDTKIRPLWFWSLL